MISWIARSNNLGIVAYDIYRNSDQIATVTTGTSYTDTTPDLTRENSYQVFARDGSGNAGPSGAAILYTFDTTGAGAPFQDIPASYQSYFYGVLTAALRKYAASVTPALRRYAGEANVPATRAGSWLNANLVTSPWVPTWGGSTIVADGQVFSGASVHLLHVFFVDTNGNGVFDPGESAWADPSNYSTSQYYDTAELVAGPAPAERTQGIGTWLPWIDLNGNGQRDPGELIVEEPALIQGTKGLMTFHGGIQWNPALPIWQDTSGDGLWQPGEPIFYAGNGSYTLQPRDFGNKQDLNYADVPTEGGSNLRIAFSDTYGEYYDSFQTDFANLYNGIRNVSIDSSNSATPGTSLGAALQAIGCPVTPIAGTISVSALYGTGTVLVTGSGTAFTRDLGVGDNIQIDGEWYGVSGIDSDTQLTIERPYYGATVTNAATERVGWTLIPTLAGDANFPALAYVRGPYGGYQSTSPPSNPDRQGPIFHEQFQELHDALEQLTGQSLPEPPGDPIPLTSVMDYENVVPDSGLDGIVNVAANVSAFGSDTGSIVFDNWHGAAQTYLPLLNTSATT